MYQEFGALADRLRERFNAQMINTCMTSKYDWKFIQQEYDSGLSHSQLYNKHGVTSRSLLLASKRGQFTSRSRSDAANLHNLTKVPVRHTDEFKDRQRANIIARYENGWTPKAGRCAKFKHISPVAGEVSLDGTWELAVAKWLDDNYYHWKRNTKRFPYTNLKGTTSHYTPDFWVEELGGYLEIKGYETELDRCKWSQFIEPLTVWKKKTLMELKLI
jgi:hypothetical protein